MTRGRQAPANPEAARLLPRRRPLESTLSTRRLNAACVHTEDRSEREELVSQGLVVAQL
jgi:hypothetical protein